eukprot:TRINITY_DN4957_c0_g1_i4.p1 TRINITY_DN4957_c0_g1~~TRINITY_DN4957_c0_g1_i4.p1  ORF type:complete len:537 (-),score=137.69 TRINITY_DN4957_c0_g1_i4:87-1697(-)
MKLILILQMSFLGVFDMIINKDFDPLPENVNTDIKMLIYALLNKDPARRPSIWEIADMKCIKEKINKFVEEQKCKEMVEAILDVEVNRKKPGDNSKKNETNGATEESKQNDANGIPFTIDKIEQLAQIIRESIQLRTEKQGLFKKFENVVTGEDLNNWFKTRFKATDDIIRKYCQEMIDQSIIHSVNDYVDFQITSKALYRFQVDKPSIAMNMYKIWSGEVRKALVVAQDLITKMNEVIQEVKVEINGEFSLSYDKIKDSKALIKYQDASCELQRCEIMSLPKLEKIAFFLNIYQVMYIHQHIKALQSAKSETKGFMSKISNLIGGSGSDFFYCINGINFTVEEIKHGVLRNNRKSPNSYFKSFGSSDSRNTLLQLRDPRIICVFFEDGMLPRKLEAYNPKDLDEKLDKITREYINSTVCYDSLEGEIILPKLFNLYKEDIGKTPSEIISWVVRYANPKTLHNPEEIAVGVKEGKITVGYADSQLIAFVPSTTLMRNRDYRYLLIDVSLFVHMNTCLLYTSPSPRDGLLSRMPSSA